MFVNNILTLDHISFCCKEIRFQERSPVLEKPRIEACARVWPGLDTRIAHDRRVELRGRDAAAHYGPILSPSRIPASSSTSSINRNCDGADIELINSSESSTFIEHLAAVSFSPVSRCRVSPGSAGCWHGPGQGKNTFFIELAVSVGCGLSEDYNGIRHFVIWINILDNTPANMPVSRKDSCNVNSNTVRLSNPTVKRILLFANIQSTSIKWYLKS